MASYEQILTRVIGEYQASNDNLRRQLDAALARIRELEGLTPVAAKQPGPALHRSTDTAA